MDQVTRTVVVVAAIATHTWLRRYDPVPVKIALLALAILPVFAAALITTQNVSTTQLGLILLQTYLTFYSTLAFSVVAYRLSPFHPLAKYPGPIILRVTKLWTVWIAYKGKNHIYLKELHDKYGPTIRIGPNELSTIEKDLIPEILGVQGLAKGPMWDARRFAQNKAEAQRPYRSIIDVRDPNTHSILRKPWSKSFAAEPLQNYERLLLPRVVQLSQHIAKEVKKGDNGVARLDVAKWVNFFSFDFMGDIAFGTSFELMRDGDPEHEHETVLDGMYLPSMTLHIPWFADLTRSIPFMNAKIQKLIALGVANGVKRSKKEIKHKDLFYYMGESVDNSVDSLALIIPNVVLAIVAGSDTSASVITNAVQLLVAHPGARQRLHRELDEAFNKHEIPDVDSAEGDMERFSDVLAGLKYLNGVINEALRLFPAVPTGLQRAPAKGTGGRLLQGDHNANIFLPEGNAICVPPYAMHRDPRYFSPRPDSFLPERWFADPAVYKTARDAFLAFSFGPRNCVGRPLAMMELRYAVATLFRNFDMKFDEEKYDEARWEDEVVDRYTLANGKLDVKVTLRTKEMRGIK